MSAPVPPLPAFGVADEQYRPGGRNMLDVLVDDHHQLMQLCTRLSSAASPSTPTTWTTSAHGASPDDLEDVLVASVARHLSAEEQYLYPTVRTALPDGDRLADEEIVADTELLAALRRLQATPLDDAAYADAVDTVTRQLGRHTHRTSREVFPRLRERCTDTDLIRLGNRVEIAREAAPTRPHPGIPHTPPLNKLVDPAVGVLDKVRDALTRRTTRPEDLVH